MKPIYQGPIFSRFS